MCLTIMKSPGIGGCEYLSDNLEELPLREKLLAFFNKKTTEGNWFDSYLLYYSGPVTETGDWVLKGKIVNDSNNFR